MKKESLHPVLVVVGAAVLGYAGYAAWKYWSQSGMDALTSHNPDHQNEDHPMQKSGRDMVDEASWESFPASDSPARY